MDVMKFNVGAVLDVLKERGVTSGTVKLVEGACEMSISVNFAPPVPDVLFNPPAAAAFSGVPPASCIREAYDRGEV
jgi:hypothetical protein